MDYTSHFKDSRVTVMRIGLLEGSGQRVMFLLGIVLLSSSTFVV